MKILPLLLASVTTLGITACAEISEQEVQSRPPPTQEAITALAKNIYTSVNRKAPKDLQVTSISQKNIFPYTEDTLVCMTAIEERFSYAQRNDGSFIYRIGDPYRENYAMIVRDGNGSLFRRATPNTEMGWVKLSDVCPLVRT
jgi:hypothetical protein